MGLDLGDSFSLITERIHSESTQTQLRLLRVSQHSPFPPGNSGGSRRPLSLDLKDALGEPQDSVLRLKASMLSILENTYENNHIKE